MNKTTIKLQGGLGNYLFEIACAYAYAKKHNKKLILNKQDAVIIHKPLDDYKDNLLKNCQEFFLFEDSKFNNFTEHGFSYQEIPFIEGDVALTGYFQTSKYFNEYEEDIRRIFSYPQEVEYETLNIFNGKYQVDLKNIESSCSIHARLGDFVGQPQYHPVQNMNYYMKAIKKMPKDSVFFIFSDNIEWCKQNFPNIPEKFVFVEGFKDYEDLLLMKSCKNNIIANSTFSWWAAYLNENENFVVCPSLWFGSAYSHYNTKDLYCENWIKI